MTDSFESSVPLVVDVSFKISAQGDMFAMEFGCRDGSVHAVALTTPALLKVLAGALWTASEAADRRTPQAVSPRALAYLRDNAPAIDEVEVTPGPDNGSVVTLTVGAAQLAVRLSAPMALDLAERLVETIVPSQGDGVRF